MKQLRSTIALRLTTWLLLLSLVPFFVMATFIERNLPTTYANLISPFQRAHAASLAAAFAGLDPAQIEDMLMENYQENGLLVFVLDGQGNYRLHVDRAMVGRSARADFSAETISALLNEAQGEVVERLDRTSLGFHRIGASEDVVVVAFKQAALENEMLRLERTSFFQLAVSLVLIALGGGGAIWITVGKPLRQLTEVAERIGQGDLSIAVDPDEMEDELFILGGTFNQMSAKLRSLISGLEQNVAQLVQAKSALEVSERRFRMIFNSVSDAISLREIETGKILEANDRMCEMYGYSRAELAELELGILSSGVKPYTAEEAWNRVQMAHAGEPQNHVWQGRRKDGSLFWVEINLRRVTVGEIDRLLVVARDITERKHAELQIQEMNAELEQRVQERTAELVAANKELEAFTYSVSHDLRAPLRAMDGFSRILLEDYGSLVPPEASHYLASIRRNAQHMGRLIDDLLALSRMGRKPLHKEQIDMTTLVKQALQLLADEQQGREIQLTIGALGSCQGDASLLQQVWVNILSNALKFTRGCAPAVIEIGCRVEDGQTLYTIRDNGVGFDMAYADKLFGVFQRLHRSDQFEGTGVGLAIVQRIIQRHGGRIWAESIPGEGTSFYFTLPIE